MICWINIEPNSRMSAAQGAAQMTSNQLRWQQNLCGNSSSGNGRLGMENIAGVGTGPFLP
jgi:hypothetical protein